MRVDKFGIKGLRGVTSNGPYWLAGRDPVQEKILDAQENLVRENKKKLVWYLKLEVFKSITELIREEEDKTAYIVGKGPSLDDLKAGHFESGRPIFTCNEAITKIESMDLDNPLYSCQCDPDVKSRADTKKGKILVTVSNLPWYSDCENMYYVVGDEIEAQELSPVGVLAIECAKFLGCNKIIFYAFDGAFGGSCNYADVIGKTSTSGRYLDAKRFKTHKKRLLIALGEMPYEVMTQKIIQSQQVDDIPSLSPDSLQEQCEEQDVLSSTESKDIVD